MEAMFKEVAGYIALVLEAVATLMIAYGALVTLVNLLRPASYNPRKPFAAKRKALLTLGVWLLLGLQFELGADIVRSAISPTWKLIGELAAIAVIRTFLNYFLEKDVERLGEPESVSEPLTTGAERIVARPSVALKAE
jgi:uncharacterized membrane protein